MSKKPRTIRRDAGESGSVITSFIVCDDVRREVNGKEILIGVYTNVIIFPSFPASVGRLIFRISLKSRSTGLKKTIFKIVDEKTNEDRMNIAVEVNFHQQDSDMILGFGMMNQVFNEETSLLPSLTLEEESLLLPRVLVRLPIDETEKIRIQPEHIP